MGSTKLIVLRTHQAIWSKKRGYGLKDDGSVVEFHAPRGTNPTMFFGGLMEGTKAALSQGVCLGVIVDDSQVVRQVAQPMTSAEANRLFKKTACPGSDRDPDTLDHADAELIVRMGRAF